MHCIVWGEPEQAVARRGEEQQPGWLSLWYLYVTGVVVGTLVSQAGPTSAEGGSGLRN